MSKTHSKKLHRVPLYVLGDGGEQLCYTFERASKELVQEVSAERNGRVRLLRTYTVAGAPALPWSLILGLRERGINYAPPLTIGRQGLQNLLRLSLRIGWRAMGDYLESSKPFDETPCFGQMPFVGGIFLSGEESREWDVMLLDPFDLTQVVLAAIGVAGKAHRELLRREN